MRARMAIYAAGLKVELREVVLKDKPPQMLAISPKATVPVLQYAVDGAEQVLEQSEDIVWWALRQSDPLGWLPLKELEITVARNWIQSNDGDFKHWLDRYKYADRFPECSPEAYRDKAMRFIRQLEAALENTAFLAGDKITLSDICVFPFVRQFAHVDKNWFDSAVSEKLHNWLSYFLQHESFIPIMEKRPKWQAGDRPTYL